MQVHCGQAAEPDSIASLVDWACGQLKEPVLGPASIDALADVLAARLAQISVVFILRTFGRRPDRLKTFQSRFWKPLVDALIIRSSVTSGRLYWFIIDHDIDHDKLLDDATSSIGMNVSGANNMNYRHVLPLPPLREIEARDVQKWLKELKTTAGITLGVNQREKIADRATKPNGNPAHVYDRLAREGFWANTT